MHSQRSRWIDTDRQTTNWELTSDQYSGHVYLFMITLGPLSEMLYMLLRTAFPGVTVVPHSVTGTGWTP